VSRKYQRVSTRPHHTHGSTTTSRPSCTSSDRVELRMTLVREAFITAITSRQRFASDVTFSIPRHFSTSTPRRRRGLYIYTTLFTIR